MRELLKKSGRSLCGFMVFISVLLNPVFAQAVEPSLTEESLSPNITNPDVTFSLTIIPTTIIPITPISTLTIVPTPIPIDYSTWHVRLNEIYSSPTTSNKEWIELYNSDLIDYDLTNWTLDDSLTTKSICKKIGTTNNIIKAKDYLVVECVSQVLNNTGDDAHLISPDGQQHDLFTYTSIDSTHSWSYFSSGWEVTSIITKNAENIKDIKINYSDWKIFLNEIYPNVDSNSSHPELVDEWVELYNADSLDHDMTNWVIDDSRASSSKIKITSKNPAGVIISSHKYLVIQISPGIFNNDGDNVFLDAPDGTNQDFYHFSSSKMALSWSKFQNNWVLSSPTPNADNLGEVLSIQTQLISISDAKKLNSTDPVTIQGSITADVNKLGKGVFYIQDDTAGIRVEMDTDLFTDPITDGDIYTITGKIDEIHNEKIIKPDSVLKIKVGTKLKPKLVNISHIDEDFEGSLIKVKGRVDDNSGSTFTVSDGKNIITISINSNTKIKKPYTRVGYYASVAGVLSQYGYKDGVAYYRLLPRVQSDVGIGKTELLAETGVNAIMQMGFGFLVITALIILNYKKVKRYIGKLSIKPIHFPLRFFTNHIHAPFWIMDKIYIYFIYIFFISECIFYLVSDSILKRTCGCGQSHLYMQSISVRVEKNAVNQT